MKTGMSLLAIALLCSCAHTAGTNNLASIEEINSRTGSYIGKKIASSGVFSLADGGGTIIQSEPLRDKLNRAIRDVDRPYPYDLIKYCLAIYNPGYFVDNADKFNDRFFQFKGMIVKVRDNDINPASCVGSKIAVQIDVRRLVERYPELK